MLAVASLPHGRKTTLAGAATLSQAHLIQRGFGTGGRTPGKILLSRVLTATYATSCRTPVIDAKYARGGHGEQAHLADQPQKGVWTGCDAQCIQQACSSLST